MLELRSLLNIFRNALWTLAETRVISIEGLEDLNFSRSEFLFSHCAKLINLNLNFNYLEIDLISYKISFIYSLKSVSQMPELVVWSLICVVEISWVQWIRSCERVVNLCFLLLPLLHFKSLFITIPQTLL